MIWEKSFRYLTAASVIMCTHGGTLKFVDLRGRAESNSAGVLTTESVLAAVIVGCPQVGPGVKPCLKVIEITKGISRMLQIDGIPALTDELDFITDADPLGNRQLM